MFTPIIVGDNRSPTAPSTTTDSTGPSAIPTTVTTTPDNTGTDHGSKQLAGKYPNNKPKDEVEKFHIAND